jgi:hypothetical protein
MKCADNSALRRIYGLKVQSLPKKGIDDKSPLLLSFNCKSHSAAGIKFDIPIVSLNTFISTNITAIIASICTRPNPLFID